MNSREYKISEVKVTDIDLSDTSFRISRPLMDERISRVVERFGYLTIPLMIKSKKGFILLTGHGSIGTAACPEKNRIASIVIDEKDSEIYIRETILMTARGEMGPLGRLKALAILKEYFRIDESKAYEIGREGYQLPDDFLSDNECIRKIEQIPPELREYIERRDISFKVIRSLFRLSGEMAGLLSRWVSAYNIRVNIFRDLVDMLFDLQRGGQVSVELHEPLPHEISDQRQYEKSIYDRVYCLRYPEYFRLKSKAEKLRSYLQNESIKIEYPEYFESSSLTLTVTLRKGADIDELSGKFESLLKSSRLRELLDLL
jgi:hypothetical protein